MALNSYYSSIVNQLCRSEQLTIPRIPYAALKPFWNHQLDDLKHDSVCWYNVWVSADKPNSGTLFQIKKNTKYKYKLAVRQAFANYEHQYDDELYKHFLSKRLLDFWKSWSKKFRRNAVNDVFIDGSNDSKVVADAFAKHFSDVYNTKRATNTEVPGI